MFSPGRIYAAGGRGERAESGYREDGTFISRKSRLLIPSAVQLSIYYKGLPFCPPPLAYFCLDTIEVIDVETGAMLEPLKMNSECHYPRAVNWNDKEVIVCGGYVPFGEVPLLNTCEAFAVHSGE